MNMRKARVGGWSKAAWTMVLVMTAPSAAWACCPDDGKTAPAARGLGESVPQAPDLAADAAWQVYEFARGGIHFIQINDSAGSVRAEVGRIGDTVFVLPAGRDVDRVLIPGDALPAGNRRVLYRSNEVEVVLIDNGTVQYWLVNPLSSTF